MNFEVIKIVILACQLHTGDVNSIYVLDVQRRCQRDLLKCTDSFQDKPGPHQKYLSLCLQNFTSKWEAK